MRFSGLRLRPRWSFGAQSCALSVRMRGLTRARRLCTGDASRGATGRRGSQAAPAAHAATRARRDERVSRRIPRRGGRHRRLPAVRARRRPPAHGRPGGGLRARLPGEVRVRRLLRGSGAADARADAGAGATARRAAARGWRIRPGDGIGHRSRNRPPGPLAHPGRRLVVRDRPGAGAGRPRPGGAEPRAHRRVRARAGGTDALRLLMDVGPQRAARRAAGPRRRAPLRGDGPSRAHPLARSRS